MLLVAIYRSVIVNKTYCHDLRRVFWNKILLKWPYFCVFFQIRQKYPASAQFLPEPDLEKLPIPAGAGIRYSPIYQ